MSAQIAHKSPFADSMRIGKTGIFTLYVNGDVELKYRPFGKKHLIQNTNITDIGLSVAPGLIHQVKIRIKTNDSQLFLVQLKKASRVKYAGSPAKKVPPILEAVYGTKLSTLNLL
jgi:hypothetical protein